MRILPSALLCALCLSLFASVASAASPKTAVRTTAASFVSAQLTVGKSSRACRVLAPAARKEALLSAGLLNPAKPTCAGLFVMLEKIARESSVEDGVDHEALVRRYVGATKRASVTVHGSKATAKATVSQDGCRQTFTYRLQRTSAGWRVASLDTKERTVCAAQDPAALAAAQGEIRSVFAEYFRVTPVDAARSCALQSVEGKISTVVLTRSLLGSKATTCEQATVDAVASGREQTRAAGGDYDALQEAQARAASSASVKVTGRDAEVSFTVEQGSCTSKVSYQAHRTAAGWRVAGQDSFGADCE